MESRILGLFAPSTIYHFLVVPEGANQKVVVVEDVDRLRGTWSYLAVPELSGSDSTCPFVRK